KNRTGVTCPIAFSACLAGAPAAFAQDAEQPTFPERRIEETIVTASRTARPINDIARSVLVLEPLVLSENLVKTSNVGDLLGAAVPGFGAPSAVDITRAQTLRGREPQYLIDGIPLTFNGGAGIGGSPLVKFDPEAIGRIEVLYGPTSVYGAGATGGVIQFFTQEPATDDPFSMRLRLQATTYTEADNPLEDEALSYKPTVSVSGKLDRFDYIAIYSHDSQNGVFDSDGNLANPVFYGFSDEDYIFTKLGFDLTDSQRIEGFFNYSEREADGRAYRLELNDNGTANAIEDEDPLEIDLGGDEPFDEKRFWNVRYLHDDLAGGTFMLQYYGRKEERASGFIDLRLASLLPTWSAAWPNNYQSSFLDEGQGLRSQFSYNPSDSISLITGIDYEEQERRSDARVFALADDFAQSGETEGVIRDDFFGFPFELETLGVFIQAEYEVNDRLRLSGGLRWEDVSFEIEGGTQVFEDVLIDGEQVARPGGSGGADDVAFNLGATFELMPELTLFANFAQGYEVPDLSQVASVVPPDATLESDDAVTPQIVDNYELGLRGGTAQWRYSLAAFYAESELGQNFIYDPVTRFGQYNRSPQENYGFEVVLGWAPIASLDLLATFSWNEGDFDPDGDGPEGDVPLTSLDVAPWKATLNARYDITTWLQLNAQILTVGDRTRAFDNGVDLGDIDGFTTVDIGGIFRWRDATVSLQVTNALNEDYITPTSQTYIGNPLFLERVAPAPGRALSVALTYDF
ncbi:MAG: TonB-dependent receptor, partial [Pseudomonadota bacterium]